MYETTKCSQWNIRTILQCSLQAYARMSTPANMGRSLTGSVEAHGVR